MDFTIEENRELLNEYPFLFPRNVFDGYIPDDYDYSYTLFDEIPDGWRKAFGMEMIKELKQILEKANFLGDYRIIQIKEKFGGLRWYDNGIPEEVSTEYDEWLNKYSDLSYETCIQCGKKSEGMTSGWIMPMCRRCAANTGKRLHNRDIL